MMTLQSVLILLSILQGICVSQHGLLRSEGGDTLAKHVLQHEESSKDVSTKDEEIEKDGETSESDDSTDSDGSNESDQTVDSGEDVDQDQDDTPQVEVDNGESLSEVDRLQETYKHKKEQDSLDETDENTVKKTEATTAEATTADTAEEVETADATETATPTAAASGSKDVVNTLFPGLPEGKKAPKTAYLPSPIAAWTPFSREHRSVPALLRNHAGRDWQDFKGGCGARDPEKPIDDSESEWQGPVSETVARSIFSECVIATDPPCYGIETQFIDLAPSVDGQKDQEDRNQDTQKDRNHENEDDDTNAAGQDANTAAQGASAVQSVQTNAGNGIANAYNRGPGIPSNGGSASSLVQIEDKGNPYQFGAFDIAKYANYGETKTVLVPGPDKYKLNFDQESLVPAGQHPELDPAHRGIRYRFIHVPVVPNKTSEAETEYFNEFEQRKLIAVGKAIATKIQNLAVQAAENNIDEPTGNAKANSNPEGTNEGEHEAEDDAENSFLEASASSFIEVSSRVTPDLTRVSRVTLARRIGGNNITPAPTSILAKTEKSAGSVSTMRLISKFNCLIDLGPSRIFTYVEGACRSISSEVQKEKGSIGKVMGGSTGEEEYSTDQDSIIRSAAKPVEFDVAKQTCVAEGTKCKALEAHEDCPNGNKWLTQGLAKSVSALGEEYSTADEKPEEKLECRYRLWQTPVVAENSTSILPRVTEKVRKPRLVTPNAASQHLPVAVPTSLPAVFPVSSTPRPSAVDRVAQRMGLVIRPNEESESLAEVDADGESTDDDQQSEGKKLHSDHDVEGDKDSDSSPKDKSTDSTDDNSSASTDDKSVDSTDDLGVQAMNEKSSHADSDADPRQTQTQVETTKLANVTIRRSFSEPRDVTLTTPMQMDSNSIKDASGDAGSGCLVARYWAYKCTGGEPPGPGTLEYSSPPALDLDKVQERCVSCYFGFTLLQGEDRTNTTCTRICEKGLTMDADGKCKVRGDSLRENLAKGANRPTNSKSVGILHSWGLRIFIVVGALYILNKIRVLVMEGPFPKRTASPDDSGGSFEPGSPEKKYEEESNGFFSDIIAMCLSPLTYCFGTSTEVSSSSANSSDVRVGGSDNGGGQGDYSGDYEGHDAPPATEEYQLGSGEPIRDSADEGKPSGQ